MGSILSKSIHFNQANLTATLKGIYKDDRYESRKQLLFKFYKEKFPESDISAYDVVDQMIVLIHIDDDINNQFTADLKKYLNSLIKNGYMKYVSV